MSDKSQLQKDIEAAINRASAENDSGTPDFILAEYLIDCLALWNRTTDAREKWYGRRPRYPEQSPAGLDIQ